MAKVCAVIVTYNPTTTLLGNVAALGPQVDEIVVVDNGSTGESTVILSRLVSFSNCQLICNNENLGIAEALNIGVRRGVASGCSWIATFDQDSLAGGGFIADLLLAWEACPYRDQVVLISPRYRDPGTGITSSYAATDVVETFSEITHSMTSGNLVRIDALLKAGLFDASLFIDCVDHEFCLRLRRHGYRLIEAHQAVLQHGLGHMTIHSLLGKRCKVYNHSPLRRYYNARNRVVLYRRYVRYYPRWVLIDLGNFCREIAGIIMFEKSTFTKLAAIGKGILHGFIGKKGKAG